MSQRFIEQVRTSIVGRNEVIKTLYADTSLRKAVIGTLVKSGCSESDAKDYFTDSIVSFVKTCYRPDFMISSSLTNYLIGTAKNIWLKAVTKSKRERTTIDNTSELSVPPIEDELIVQERRVLLKLLLDQLDETCRKVLTLWSINNKMKEIANKMTYKSEGMARKKKHQCLRKLYKIVEENEQIKKDLSAI